MIWSCGINFNCDDADGGATMLHNASSAYHGGYGLRGVEVRCTDNASARHVPLHSRYACPTEHGVLWVRVRKEASCKIQSSRLDKTFPLCLRDEVRVAAAGKKI